MPAEKRWGSTVRRLRRQAGLNQTELARRLGISVSYLNMIEHDRRALSAPVLVELARVLRVDLDAFGSADEEHLLSDLMEVFADPLFDSSELINVEIRELVHGNPSLARGVRALYAAYQEARKRAENLAFHLAEDDATGQASTHLVEPLDEISAVIQRHGNYFPELEAGAEAIGRRVGLDPTDIGAGLVHLLRREHGIEVEIRKVGELGGAIRRYSPERKLLELSEVLRRGSRNFQLAYVLGLLTQGELLDRFAADPRLSHEGSRTLCRVALSNYFAAALLMPYQAFWEAARDVRYDIDLLGHRFRASPEQVCHRLTTLRRPGMEGVPFHVVRTDIAGNVSKSFSATGMRFSRYGGACPRWNVFRAFMTPGRYRVGLSRMPDGMVFFEVAFTMQKESRGYLAAQPVQALGIGCHVEQARELVYADGLDLANLAAATPIGVSCRLCERMDCEERAFPPIQHPLKVDEYVRALSFYAPVPRGSIE
jgi:predicted transcriptional regulator/transcriptional regulator with XRE-family HTH domain